MLNNKYSLVVMIVSEMTYTVSSGTLNSTIPYHCGHEEQCTCTNPQHCLLILVKPFVVDLAKLMSVVVRHWERMRG